MVVVRKREAHSADRTYYQCVTDLTRHARQSLQYIEVPRDTVYKRKLVTV